MRNDLRQLTDILKPYFKPTSFMEVGCILSDENQGNIV
jgi:hypothetical protein